MKSYNQFVAESNQAIDNLQEGWRDLAFRLGKGAFTRLTKGENAIDTIKAIYGTQRALQALPRGNDKKFDEFGFYNALGVMVPGSAGAIPRAVSYGSFATDLMRRRRKGEAQRKSEEERRKKKAEEEARNAAQPKIPTRSPVTNPEAWSQVDQKTKDRYSY